MARIDKKLNLVFTVDLASGARGHVHATPISREVFEDHFMLLAKVVSDLYTEGLNNITGPRVAALYLRKLAKARDEWEGDAGVERTLMAEIIRLAHVAVPSATGYDDLPLHDALAQGLLDEEAAAQLENALVFFISVSSVFRRSMLGSTLASMGGLWATETTPSNSTEWLASLRASIKPVISAPAAGSLVPS